MRKYFHFFAFLGFVLNINAQSLSKDLLSVSGGNFSNETSIISFSVGENIVGIMTAEDYTVQLGNGYYPSLNFEALSVNIPELNIKVKVFPNPVNDLIFISHPEEDFFEVEITDLNGKLILSGIYQKHNPILVSTFESGTYLVKVTTKQNKRTNTYKIIKK